MMAANLHLPKHPLVFEFPYRPDTALLFDSLQKQIRSGFFVLPNGSVAVEPQS